MTPTASDTPAWLTGLWYLAGLSRELKPGDMLRRDLFGAPVALGRGNDGKAFALRDVCPHRAAPLSAGRVIAGDETSLVACPYHGWAFRADNGACARIPASIDPAPEAIRVETYRLHEENGLIWIFHGEGEPGIAPPEIGYLPDAQPNSVTIVEAEGPYDEAVLGLVDPAHTPVVHKQWWWRDGAPRKDKTKQFEPTALGFRMPPHAPSSNSRIYKIFGGAPTTEIEFRLPGLRLEHIRAGRTHVLGLTAMTPIAKDRTRITHMLYWNRSVMSVLTPFIRRMSDSFLAQDGAILTLQSQNLSRMDHRPLYVGDADEPSKWYYRLKRNCADAQQTGASFTNPVTPATLVWRT